MNRRNFLTLTGLAALLGARQASSDSSARAGKSIKPLDKPEEEWRKILSPEAYGVLFEENTERPWSSALNKEKRAGTYVCAACYLPLFDARTKFESGTGWPSFFTHLTGRIATKQDWKTVFVRTEYHCARCGGHQGHVFDDGPEPTGQRWCNNGLALQFVPKGQKLPALRS